MDGKNFLISREDFVQVLRYNHYIKPIESIRTTRLIFLVASMVFNVAALAWILIMAPSNIPILFFMMSGFYLFMAAYKTYEHKKLKKEWLAWEESCKVDSLRD
ncbi:MAG TPA: hypothetical protein VMX17_07660 [Candidatus Glassbacteria bacterium]|nr:hypothetical protein [Candidatus Glassbacteria bacterium]